MSAEILELKGLVCSGLDKAAGFTQMEWVMREFRDKLGFAPYPGTLNLQMQGASWERARRRLLAGKGIVITPESGACGAKCFLLSLGDEVRGAAVFPEIDTYPVDKLEVVAPAHLRSALRIYDGDQISVRIDVSDY
ncbi:DUF120 domain-containing protein [Aromatoleum buckelii]|uniref:Riboflavin kinase n=1 Tax=Aromatoleum buckelii TaxID=200254 RepID=A0ABX1N350_9RHOO|nr:DUF120 domain-containing protein [Aromatoleum buckelii]MCK0513185.1 CTP-dependent riboflavin kinase [Aromatoleum buckelii]